MADITQIKIPSGTYDLRDPSKLSASLKGAANGVAELDANAKVQLSQLPVYTGATSETAGVAGVVPGGLAAHDRTKFLRGDGTWQEASPPMVILRYGISTWQDYMDAMATNNLVYCQAGTGDDPATPPLIRMAFLAYQEDTKVEFQYYRSLSASAQVNYDAIYVYTLSRESKWSVQVRHASVELIAGTNISTTFNKNAKQYTVNCTLDNETAESGGTTLSLVTTGDKYSWDNKIDSSEKGSANGVAELNSNGTVPLSQLPSSLDNIAEYADYTDFPLTGVSDVLYIDTTSNGVYRWNGTSYVQLNASSSITTITNAEIDALFT